MFNKVAYASYLVLLYSVGILQVSAVLFGQLVVALFILQSFVDAGFTDLDDLLTNSIQAI